MQRFCKRPALEMTSTSPPDVRVQTDATPRPQLERPSVYVMLQDQKRATPKRVLIPRTMANLMRVCGKIWQQGDAALEIRSLLNEQGFLIESIRRVAPGSTVYASTIDPAFVRRDPALEKELTPSSPFATPTKSPRDRDSPKAVEDPDPPKSPILFRRSQLKAGALSTARSVNLRELSRKKGASEDSDDNPTTPQSKSASKMVSFLQKTHDASDDEDEATKRRRAERKAKQEGMKSAVTLSDEANLPILQLIEDLVLPQNAPQSLEAVLGKISADRVRFIQTSPDVEDTHLYLWIKKALEQPFLNRGPHQDYHDPVTQVATDFFVRHRFEIGRAHV
jgi:hypothetical protein